MKTKKKATVEVKVDVAKIFLTPPSSMAERIMLVVFLTLSFIAFFGPLSFSAMPPLEAVLTAAMPALSTSWGLVVLYRSMFRKMDYCKK